MKKKSKILVAFLTLFIAVGFVSALDNTIRKTGSLTNEVISNIYTKRNTIEGEAKLNSTFLANMTNVKNVSGTNAEGGIRVKTTAKRYTLGIVSSEKEMIIPVYPTTTTSSTAKFVFNSDSNKTKVQWQNWTGNTSFDATFNAN